jgi:ferredoxin
VGTVIFYFTATGNTLQIARGIAEELNNSVILPMTKAVTNPIGGDGESIGFVFPVYFNGLPRLVRQFVEGLCINHDTYCFAIANSGGTRSNSLCMLGDTLVTKDVHLSFASEIKMPGSYIITHNPPDRLQTEKLITEATIKIKKIANAISKHELRPAKQKAKLWSKIVNERFLYRNANKWDDKFIATSKCVNCGLCVKVCPVGNVRIENKRPSWQNNCEKCLACIHWCPYGAIEYGKNTIGRIRYHNPNIKVEDIVNSREAQNN